MNKEIEEAVKINDEHIKNCMDSEEKCIECHSIKIVNDLAKRYLEIKGFPEEKTFINNPFAIEACNNPEYRRGYSSALQECKLAHILECYKCKGNKK